jgi:tetratricopeptide (TPR) repeat protein
MSGNGKAYRAVPWTASEDDAINRLFSVVAATEDILLPFLEHLSVKEVRRIAETGAITQLQAVARQRDWGRAASLLSSAQGEARSQLETAPRAGEGTAQSLYVKALDEKSRGKHSEAVELLKRAVAASPADADYGRELAFTYFEAGDAEKAVRFSSDWLKTSPGSSRGWLTLAYVQVGDFEAASTSFLLATWLADSRDDLRNEAETLGNYSKTNGFRTVIKMAASVSVPSRK